MIEFWNHILNLNLTNFENPILGGDLNFSIGHAESWGHNAQLNPLSNTMELLLEQHELVDVPMNKMHPTWCNKRTGESSLARRLDCFLTKENLVKTLTNFRQWVGFGGIFDHSPIFLELLSPFQKPRAPFKFNST